MPNHCWNVVNMHGIADCDFFNENQEFDFNKIIECPPVLYEQSSPQYAKDVDLREVIITAIENLIYNDTCSYISSQYFVSKLPVLRKEREALNKIYEEYNFKREDVLRAGLERFKILIQYGYSSWYEFCTSVWGTKWNAWDTFLLDNNTVEFTTAWAPPVGIFQKISEMYPYNLITVDWSEEGGMNGILQYHGGECICDREYVYDPEVYEDYYAIEDAREKRLFTKVNLIGPLPIEGETLEDDNQK